MYQEPYQAAAAAAAASVAGGYQTQNTQDLSTGVGGPHTLATNVSLTGSGGSVTGSVNIGPTGGGGGGVSNVGGGIGNNTLFSNTTVTTANIDCVKYPQEFWSQLILSPEQRLLQTLQQNPMLDEDEHKQEVGIDQDKKYPRMYKKEYNPIEGHRCRVYSGSLMEVVDDGDISYLSTESTNLDLTPLHNPDNEIGCNLYCC